VINNAGISTHSLIEWCPVDSLSKLIDVNTIGVVRVTKTFLPLLRESQGRIVIVASAAGNSNIVQPEFTAKNVIDRKNGYSVPGGLCHVQSRRHFVG
jgi:NADP-dependent 3-hydroxy acid dehydrogenase YdfG